MKWQAHVLAAVHTLECNKARCMLSRMRAPGIGLQSLSASCAPRVLPTVTVLLGQGSHGALLVVSRNVLLRQVLQATPPSATPATAASCVPAGQTAYGQAAHRRPNGQGLMPSKHARAHSAPCKG